MIFAGLCFTVPQMLKVCNIFPQANMMNIHPDFNIYFEMYSKTFCQESPVSCVPIPSDLFFVVL